MACRAEVIEEGETARRECLTLLLEQLAELQRADQGQFNIHGERLPCWPRRSIPCALFLACLILLSADLYPVEFIQTFVRQRRKKMPRRQPTAGLLPSASTHGVIGAAAHSQLRLW